MNESTQPFPFSQPSMEPIDTDPVVVEVPPEFSESQLREQYENAEIQRFLHIFSTYVTEVKSSNVPELSRNPLSTSLDGDPATSSSTDASYYAAENSLSASIAERYLVPSLPLQQREIPPFTLARVRLTVNRLYIIAQVQWPRLKETADLAMWTDFRKSLVGCLLYWFLWWNNLILPALLLSMLVGLLRRGIFPYPSLEDLKEHHRRISEADQFSDQVSHKISPSSTLDIKEMWRLYRLASSGWQKRFRAPKPHSPKPHSPGALNANAGASRSSLNLNRSSIDSNESRTEFVNAASDDATILDDPEATKETLELKRYALHAFTEVADFYERARNIVIWRNPAVSKRYSLILFVLLLATTFIPTRYLAKATWCGIGFAFWHVVPVLCALSPADLKRLPPPLADAPTDAEYAMNLISVRVAKGEDVQAVFGKKHAGKNHKPGTSGGSPPKLPERPWSPPPGQSKLKGIGKMIGNEGLKMAKEAMKNPSIASLPLLAGAMAIAAPDADSNLHTFTGQRGSNPGVITLTGKRLVFTPFVSPQSKLDIDVGSITGVRKNGVLKGLHVSYLDPVTNAPTEEKFLWISGRDELFARLVGFGKKKWQNV